MEIAVVNYYATGLLSKSVIFAPASHIAPHSLTRAKNWLPKPSHFSLNYNNASRLTFIFEFQSISLN